MILVLILNNRAITRLVNVKIFVFNEIQLRENLLEESERGSKTRLRKEKSVVKVAELLLKNVKISLELNTI